MNRAYGWTSSSAINYSRRQYPVNQFLVQRIEGIRANMTPYTSSLHTLSQFEARGVIQSAFSENNVRIKNDPSQQNRLYERQNDFTLLDQAIFQDRIQLVGFLGWGHYCCVKGSSEQGLSQYDTVIYEREGVRYQEKIGSCYQLYELMKRPIDDHSVNRSAITTGGKLERLSYQHVHSQTTQTDHNYTPINQSTVNIPRPLYREIPPSLPYNRTTAPIYYTGISRVHHQVPMQSHYETSRISSNTNVSRSHYNSNNIPRSQVVSSTTQDHTVVSRSQQQVVMQYPQGIPTTFTESHTQVTGKDIDECLKNTKAIDQLRGLFRLVRRGNISVESDTFSNIIKFLKDRESRWAKLLESIQSLSIQAKLKGMTDVHGFIDTVFIEPTFNLKDGGDDLYNGAEVLNIMPILTTTFSNSLALWATGMLTTGIQGSDEKMEKFALGLMAAGCIVAIGRGIVDTSLQMAQSSNIPDFLGLGNPALKQTVTQQLSDKSIQEVMGSGNAFHVFNHLSTLTMNGLFISGSLVSALFNLYQFTQDPNVGALSASLGSTCLMISQSANIAALFGSTAFKSSLAVGGWFPPLLVAGIGLVILSSIYSAYKESKELSEQLTDLSSVIVSNLLLKRCLKNIEKDLNIGLSNPERASEVIGKMETELRQYLRIRELEKEGIPSHLIIEQLKPKDQEYICSSLEKLKANLQSKKDRLISVRESTHYRCRAVGKAWGKIPLSLVSPLMKVGDVRLDLHEDSQGVKHVAKAVGKVTKKILYLPLKLSVKSIQAIYETVRQSGAALISKQTKTQDNIRTLWDVIRKKKSQTKEPEPKVVLERFWNQYLPKYYPHLSEYIKTEIGKEWQIRYANLGKRYIAKKSRVMKGNEYVFDIKRAIEDPNFSNEEAKKINDIILKTMCEAPKSLRDNMWIEATDKLINASEKIIEKDKEYIETKMHKNNDRPLLAKYKFSEKGHHADVKIKYNKQFDFTFKGNQSTEISFRGKVIDKGCVSSNLRKEEGTLLFKRGEKHYVFQGTFKTGYWKVVPGVFPGGEHKNTPKEGVVYCLETGKKECVSGGIITNEKSDISDLSILTPLYSMNKLVEQKVSILYQSLGIC